SSLAVAPIVAASATGETRVDAASGRLLPALVAAEAAQDPGLGTLVLDPQPDGSLEASVQRGAGTTLDAVSTLPATTATVGVAGRELAELAGNLASRGGFDPVPHLTELRIGFVLVRGAEPAGPGAEVRQRAAEAL